MVIPFACPHCGSYTNVDDEYAGQSGPCASCGKTITIPTVPAVGSAYGRPQTSAAGGGRILVAAGIVVLVCGGLVALLLPARETAGEAARRAQCMNNLKQIALGMHNYHDTYGCLPAAVLTDEEGNPRRSWRVAILPFIEQQPTYDRYHFDESWDSPSNLALQDTAAYAYRCPSDRALVPGETNYVMIAGKGTVGGEPNEVVKMSDITDGTSNTIMAVEVAGSGILWLEPRDMTIDEAVAYIANPSGNGRKQSHPGGVNVAMVDGSVRFIPNTIDRQTLRGLMTRDGGEPVELP